LKDDAFDRLALFRLHPQAQYLPGCRISQQKVIVLVGDQYGIRSRSQDGSQTLASNLGVQEQAGVGSC
jgi:hypothetical protein